MEDRLGAIKKRKKQKFPVIRGVSNFILTLFFFESLTQIFGYY